MAATEVAPFQKTDCEEVARLWTDIFRDYPLSPEVLRKQTFGYPDFDPEGVWTARAGHSLVGFVFATARRRHETGAAQIPGCVEAIMVHPAHRRRGIGTALLEKGMAFLRSKGKGAVKAGYPLYLPGTFFTFLGVSAGWPEGLAFFEKYGFREVDRIQGLIAPISGFEIPAHIAQREKTLATKGISVGPMTKAEEAGLLDFLASAFPEYLLWHDHYYYRAEAGRIAPEDTMVVRVDGKVAGFAGPVEIAENEGILGSGIGIAEELRGRGIGTVLLFKAMGELKNRGARRVHVFGPAKGLDKTFYPKAGYRPADLWVLLEREVETE